MVRIPAFLLPRHLYKNRNVFLISALLPIRKREEQPNHKKHKLERFDDSEITDTVDHAVDVCPECGAVMEHRGNMRTKDELDFRSS